MQDEVIQQKNLTLKNHMSSSSQSGTLYVYNTETKREQFWEKVLRE